MGNMGLQQIVVLNRSGKFKRSIYLNALFLGQLLFAIDAISDNVSLNSVFEQFLIMEPSDPIKEFIAEHRSLFAKKGWSLKKTTHKFRTHECSNVLAIKYDGSSNR